MNELEKSPRTGFPIATFLTGAVIGSGIALLTTRKTGHEARECMKGAFTDAGKMAKDYFEKGKSYVDDLQRKLKSSMTHQETESHA